MSSDHMNRNSFTKLHQSIAKGFIQDYAAHGVLARRINPERPNDIIEEQIFESTQANEFADWIIDVKTDSEEVEIWPRDGNEGQHAALHRYPTGVKASYLKIQQIEENRIAAIDLASIPEGWSESTSGRSGYLYFREGDNILEIATEMSAVKQYDILIYENGFQNWIVPLHEPLTNEQRQRTAHSLANWLKEQKIRSTFDPNTIS